MDTSHQSYLCMHMCNQVRTYVHMYTHMHKLTACLSVVSSYSTHPKAQISLHRVPQHTVNILQYEHVGIYVHTNYILPTIHATLHVHTHRSTHARTHTQSTHAANATLALGTAATFCCCRVCSRRSQVRGSKVCQCRCEPARLCS